MSEPNETNVDGSPFAVSSIDWLDALGEEWERRASEMGIHSHRDYQRGYRSALRKAAQELKQRRAEMESASNGGDKTHLTARKGNE